MDYSGLGSIVSGLQLRDVHNMSAHACSSHEAPLSECRLQLLTVNGSLLKLLSSPVCACHTSTVKCAVEIRGYNFVVMLKLPIKCCTLCPRNARISNEYIETTIEFADDCFDTSGYGIMGSHVDLVCFAWVAYQVSPKPSLLRSTCAPIEFAS
jgi:hypothetical protein